MPTQVAVVQLASELLGRIANGETIGVDVLEGLALAVLDANEITRLAVCVLDDREAYRLTRAIELAARVIEGESVVDLGTTRSAPPVARVVGLRSSQR